MIKNLTMYSTFKKILVSVFFIILFLFFPNKAFSEDKPEKQTN